MSLPDSKFISVTGTSQNTTLTEGRSYAEFVNMDDTETIYLLLNDTPAVASNTDGQFTIPPNTRFVYNDRDKNQLESRGLLTSFALIGSGACVCQVILD